MIMKNAVLNRFYPMIAVGGMFLLLISACKKSNDGPDPVPVSPLLTTTLTLSGANEVPVVAAAGTGTAKITYDKDKKTITYDVSWHLGDENSVTTGMHFHGSETGSDQTNSPVVVLIPDFTSAHTGTVAGTTRALTDAESAQLLAGKWYINIHSNLAPGGEMRANIKLTDNTSNNTTGGNNTGY
jgi:hypothetical protein